METLRDLDLVRAWSQPTQIRAAADDGSIGLMEVRFSAFGKWYEIDSWWEGRFLEQTVGGAFKKTIKERRDQIKVLYDHGYDAQIGNKVLGPIAYLEEESDGPRSEVPLFDTTYNRDLLPGLEAGVYGSSFRFRVIKDEWNDDPGKSKHNPEGLPERTIKEVRLFEFGPVTFPANPESTVGMRSATDAYYERLRESNPRQYDDLLARAQIIRTPGQAAALSTAAPVAATQDDDEPALGHSARSLYLQWKARQRNRCVTHRRRTMKRLLEIRARLAEIQPDIVRMGEADGLTPEDETRLAELITEFDALEAESKPLEEREAKLAHVRSHVIPQGRTEDGDGVRGGTPAVHVKKDPFEALVSRGAGMNDREFRAALVDGALRANEGRIDDGDNQAHYEKVLKRHASDVRWASNILARSRPEYESGWAKLMMGRPELLDNEERAALSVGSNTNGGFLVPTHLDPTIILTNSGTSNVIRSMSRVVSLTVDNTWNGVTSAGVTASFDAELTEVSDDSPTFARVSIDVHKAQAFVQASIESFEDISGLASDVLMLFADARDRLEGARHATGSGTNEPTGIFTALDANTNVEITSTTAATIGEVDLHSIYRQVPIRWRNRSTWLSHPLFSLAVKRLGTAVSSAYSGDLTQPVSERWLGRPVVESDDAPSTTTTTALDNEIVLGDFSNFIIVDKPGSMAVEFVPHLFNTTTNLPDGRRGWYAHWRTGSDSVNDVAFRLLQDKTSA